MFNLETQICATNSASARKVTLLPTANRDRKEGRLPTAIIARKAGLSGICAQGGQRERKGGSDKLMQTQRNTVPKFQKAQIESLLERHCTNSLAHFRSVNTTMNIEHILCVCVSYLHMGVVAVGLEDTIGCNKHRR